MKQIESVIKICLQAQAGLKQQYDEANRADMDALKRSYLEPASRIAQIEQVQRLLDALPTQPAEGGQLTQKSEALAALEELKQYFLGQMPTKRQ